MLKVLKLALFTSVFALHGTEPALAGPLIGAAVAFFSTGFGAIVGNLLISVGLSVVGGLLGNIFAPKPDKRDPGTSVEVTFGDDNAQEFPIGPTASSGTPYYSGSWGQSGDIPNAYFVQAKIVSDMPSQSTGFWANDQKLTLGSTAVAQGYPVIEYRSNSGKDHVWIKYLDGTQASADPYMRDKFGGHSEYPYTAGMVGRGRAITIVTVLMPEEDDRDLISGVPEVLTELEGIALYDMSKDSTAGGSGSHRWGNPSTWEPSANRAVQMYNIMRGIYYNGEWVYGGQNWDAFRFPSSNWIAAINACNLSVGKKGGGSEPQFHGGAMVSCETEPATAVDELLKSSNAMIAELGGVYKVRVGAPGAPIFGFTDGDIIVSRPEGYSPFDPIQDGVNRIDPTYQEPESRWAMVGAPAILEQEFIDEDGQILPVGISFPWVQSNTTTQRLCEAILKNSRRWRVHEFALPPSAWIVEALDVLAWTSLINGYVGKGFEVETIERHPNFVQSVRIREVDPSDYDWDPALDERDFTIVPVTPLPRPVQSSNIVFEPTAFLDGDSNEWRPGIQVITPTGLADTRGIDIQIRAAQTLHMWFDDRMSYKPPIQIIPVALPGDETFECRARFASEGGNRSIEWTAWQTVKTLPIYIDASRDVLDDSVVSAKIRDAAITASKLMDEAVTNIKLADEAVSAAKIEAGAVLEEKLADNAVSLSKIQDGAINAAKFATGIRPVEIVSSLPTSGNFAGRMVFLTTDDKLYRHTGSPAGAAGFTAAVDADDIDGTLENAQIESLAASKITGQLTDAQIAAVAAAKLTGQITEVQISDNAISAPKIEAGAVTTDKVAANAIVAEKIATNAITAVKIEAGAVEAAKIAAGAVTTAKLDALAVTADKIAANAVTADKVQANAITAGKIAAGAVGADEISANSITARHLVIADYQNIINNGRFDDGFDGWEQVSSDYDIRPSDSIGGASATAPSPFVLALPASGQQTMIWDAMIPVAPGDQFLITADYAGTGGGSERFIDMRLITRYFDKDMAVLSNDQSPAMEATSTSWSSFSTTRIVPSDAVSMRFEVRRATGGVGTGLLTNIRLMRRADAELIVDGAIIASKIAADAVTANKIATNAVTADKIAANSITGVKIQGGTITGNKIAGNTITGDKLVAYSITAREMVLTDFENIITNGRADQGLDGWINIDSSISALPALRSTTQNAFRFLDEGTNMNWGTLIPVQPGDQFLFSVGANSSGSGSNVQFSLQARWHDKDGTYFSNDTNAQDVPQLGDGDETVLTWYRTAPANAAYLRVRPVRTNDGSGRSAWISNIRVIRRKNAELIVDGAITADKIAANAVTTNALAAGAVTANTIASNAVTSVKIQARSVVSDKIAFNGVETENIILDGATQSRYSSSGSGSTTGTLTRNALSINYSAGAVSGTIRMTYALSQSSGLIEFRVEVNEGSGWSTVSGQQITVNEADTFYTIALPYVHRPSSQGNTQYRLAVESLGVFSTVSVTSTEHINLYHIR